MQTTQNGVFLQTNDWGKAEGYPLNCICSLSNINQALLRYTENKKTLCFVVHSPVCKIMPFN